MDRDAIIDEPRRLAAESDLARFLTKRGRLLLVCPDAYLGAVLAPLQNSFEQAADDIHRLAALVNVASRCEPSLVL